MKNSRGTLSVVTLPLLAGLALLLASPGRAQIWSQIMAEKNLTAQEVAPEKVPEYATFWSFSRTNYPPLPFNQFPELPVYYLGFGNAFLVDDSSVDFVALAEARETDKALRRLELENGLRVADELDALEAAESEMMQMAYEYPTNNALWLEITSVTNDFANLIVHGTVADEVYEILSQESLTNGPWASEGTILGAAEQNWTATMISVGLRTNSLFLWARSWQDSDGDGLPDWWELEHGLDPHNADTGDTGVSDGYKDSDNDGWTNLEEYQHGTNPNQFNTPPAPRGLTVYFHSVGATVDIHWQPAAGPVTSYTIERWIPELWQLDTFTVAANTNQFLDDFPLDEPSLEYYSPTYRIQAHYTAGSSPWSEEVPLYDAASSFTAYLVRGPQASNYLAVTLLTPDTVALRLSRIDEFLQSPPYTTFIIGVTDLVAGVFLMPEAWLYPTVSGYDPYWTMQAVSASGKLSEPTFLGYLGLNSFFDGREQLKQNLQFLLRAASVNSSFAYRYDDGYYSPYVIHSPTNYAFAGLYETYDGWAYPSESPEAFFDPSRPFDENHRYRNFAFNTTNLTASGRFNTGVFWDLGYGAALDYPPVYLFVPPTSSMTIPALLNPAQSRWLYSTEIIPWSDGLWETIGITFQEPNWVMTGGARNLFGLPYLSAKLAWGSNLTDTVTLNANGSTLAYAGYFYPETAQPELQTVDYYFGRPYVDWLPGHNAFSTTNTTSLLIAGFGQSFDLVGYAKLAITNGYTNKFGYLGQYFDKAFKTTNGVATTNETGILSPYGEFFPTEPGPTALVTMPDLDTNERGTATVHVVKLQLDVNHDGVMDLSFAGPDNTAWNKPFRFWINNDWDISDPDGEPGHDRNTALGDWQTTFIESQRDLEDFARLWICGLPALPTNQDYSVTLSMTVQSGSPAINLFTAVETNGGTGYLTDTNVAAAQLAGPPFSGPHIKIATISASQSFTFPGSYFTNAGNKCFLFEGAGIGKGSLVMTIYQGSNVIAQTWTTMDFKDVKDMFEHAHIENVTDYSPNSFLSTYKEDNFTDASSDEEKKLIVFVHGWRMGMWDYNSFSETMFKRFYWQGFRGRFVSLRWPTLSKDDFKLPLLDYATYNASELRAFKSGRGVSDYLNHLKQRFPDYPVNVCAHSMGNIVMMEALKRDLSVGRTNVNNYVLMQAAVPAHCYDTSLPNYGVFTNAEQAYHTPDTYRGYPGTISAAVKNHMVNFYNTNDYALAKATVGNWEQNQTILKPNTAKGYTSDGTNGFKDDVLVTENREVMSFVARPRSKAVGAQPSVGGVIYVLSEVNLNVNFGFDNKWDEHSAQFNWNIQRLNTFYAELLSEIFPQP